MASVVRNIFAANFYNPPPVQRQVTYNLAELCKKSLDYRAWLSEDCPTWNDAFDSHEFMDLDALYPFRGGSNNQGTCTC